MRPFLPLVLVSGFQTPGGMLMQGSLFGIGPNSSLNQFTGRLDLSLQLVWQFDAFGIGNLARVKQQRGDRIPSHHRSSQDAGPGGGGSDRSTGKAPVGDRPRRSGRARLRESNITLTRSIEGLGQTTRFGDVLQLVFRPQEVVFALQVMKTSLDEYFTTVADYNRAQFLLFHALGYPAREIALQSAPRRHPARRHRAAWVSPPRRQRPTPSDALNWGLITAGVIDQSACSRALMSTYARSTRALSAATLSSEPGFTFTWRMRLPVPTSKPAGSSSSAPRKTRR